jgi:hypothetical protein
MDKRDKFLLELERTFNTYVRWAVDEMDGPSAKPYVSHLMNASAIPDGNLAHINSAIKKTASWLKDFEYNHCVSNLDTIRQIRKTVEQLSSIYLVSSAHPDDAMRRAIRLRPTMVAKKMVVGGSND